MVPYTLTYLPLAPPLASLQTWAEGILVGALRCGQREPGDKEWLTALCPGAFVTCADVAWGQFGDGFAASGKCCVQGGRDDLLLSRLGKTWPLELIKMGRLCGEEMDCGEGKTLSYPQLHVFSGTGV
jgi:hypothetical protein